MIADRQTDKHTHTDTHITILRSPIGGGVTTLYRPLVDVIMAAAKLEISGRCSAFCAVYSIMIKPTTSKRNKTHKLVNINSYDNDLHWPQRL